MNDIQNLYNKAMEAKKSGDFKEALQYFLETSAILEKVYKDNPYQPNLATLYNNIGFLYSKMGEYTNAHDYYQKALTIKKKVLGTDHPDTASCYYNMGALYQVMVEYDTALEYHKKALTIREKVLGTEHPDTAASDNNIGVLYQEMGEYKTALEYHKKALTIKEKVLGTEHPDTVKSYNNIGVLYKKMGEYVTALTYYEKALTIREKVLGTEHLDTATIYNNIGLPYQKMGEYVTALVYLQKALTIREGVLGTEHPDTTEIYNNIGALYQEMGEHETALTYYKKALTIQEKVLGTKHPNTAASYNNMGLLYQKMGEYVTALTYHQKDLTIIEKVLGTEHPDTATSYNNIGLLFQDMGDYDSALDYHKKALTIQEKVLGTKHPDTASSYNNIGVLYRDWNKPSLFYHYAHKAYISHIQHKKLSFDYLSQAQKHQFNKSNSHYLENLFESTQMYLQMLEGTPSYPSPTEESAQERDILAALPEDPITIQVTLLSHWLRYKGAISDFENIITILYHETQDEALKSLITQREALRKQLSALYHSKENDPDKLAQQRVVIHKTEEGISKIELSLTKASKALSFEHTLEQIDTAMLSSVLKEKELYIDYAYINNCYYLFTLDAKSKIHLSIIDKERSHSINTHITSYLEDIDRCSDEKYHLRPEDKQEHQAILHTLYTLIIEPYGEIFANTTYHKLILSLDGQLNHLPFEALYDGKNYLIETKDITYIPSGKELVRLRGNQSNQSSTIALFANPDFDKEVSPSEQTEEKENNNQEDDDPSHHRGFRSLNELCTLGERPFGALPGTQEELRAIEGIIPQKERITYTRSEANKANFLKTSHIKILHCATHAFYLNCPDTENPLLKTGIAFAGANIINKDGSRPHIATGLELAAMKLKGTEMVILSACESATGDIRHAEGVQGINKAFIQAGARSVVASLWKAHDLFTAEFFTFVYKQLDKALDEEYRAIQNKQPYTINYANLIRDAKLHFIKNDKHSLYWSGFVVNG